MHAYFELDFVFATITIEIRMIEYWLNRDKWHAGFMGGYWLKIVFFVHCSAQMYFKYTITKSDIYIPIYIYIYIYIYFRPTKLH